jgi:CMP-N-acetylneuraminic acid synthetase
MKLTKEITDQVIDHLTQASYNEQRRRFPEVYHKKWGAIYGGKEQILLEKNFQKVLTIASK